MDSKRLKLQLPSHTSDYMGKNTYQKREGDVEEIALRGHDSPHFLQVHSREKNPAESDGYDWWHDKLQQSLPCEP